MFKKLRNKFLILNLVSITIMMFIGFVVIYFMTYQNVYSGVKMDLGRLSEIGNMNFNQKRPNFNPDFNSGFNSSDNQNPIQDEFKKFPIDEIFENNSEITTENNTNFQPKRFNNDIQDIGIKEKHSLYFIIKADRSSMEITDVQSNIELEEDFYTQAFGKIDTMANRIKYFKLDGNYWAYTIKYDTKDTMRVVFTDITAQRGILSNLILTFILVSILMIAVIFILSKMFADKAIKPIKESFEKQKQFVADASHELKTPVAVMNTNIDVILANKDSTIREQEKWLLYIKSETERMSKLVNDLLYLTRMDYSEQTALFTKFDLSEIADNIILTMEAVFFEKGINLNSEIKENIKVFGNPEQLKQVIMILTDNAIKYTKKNGTVDINVNTNQGNAIIKVSNTGDEIAEEYLDKIFDRFYRTDNSRTRESGGYGLGLSIAKSIVTSHKGKIYAKSTKNGDEFLNTFYVELPVLKDNN